MLKRNILLVEDDDQTSMIIKFVLNHAGYLVKEAPNGYDAIDRLDKFHFDLILLDLNMPMMNGFEFLERLKKMETHRNTPVIVLTVRNDESSIAKAKKLGADQYLLKPPAKDLLLKKIENLLGGEPQYRRIKLDPKSKTAQAHLQFNGQVVSVSEVGMILHSPIPLETQRIVTEINCELFRQLQIEQPKLFVCECQFDQAKGCYVIFLSFSDLSDQHISTIRQWVVAESFKRTA